MLFNIAREGYSILLTIACIAAGLMIVSFFCGPQAAAVMRSLAALAVLFFSFSLYFFRDPERRINADPHALLAPADGTVIDVRQVDEPRYMQGKAQRISIFMSVFNVHVNRSPASGTIEQVRYHQGKFISAFKEKASEDNENLFVGLVWKEHNRRIAVAFIAGLIARRIVFYKRLHDTVSQGERINMIRFGSRVDLYVPADVPVSVKKGDKVTAGLTVVARVKDS